MKICVGNVYHVGYYSTIQTAEIILTPCVLKIYVIQNPNTKVQISNIDQITQPLKQVCEINIDTKRSVKVSYDKSGYENGKTKNFNENFKLLIDDKVVHSAQYIQTYVIEFEGSYVLQETMFVDH